MDTKYYEKAYSQAEKVIRLDLEEARMLPGMLGKMVPAMLKERGCYATTVDGRKTLYVCKIS